MIFKEKKSNLSFLRMPFPHFMRSSRQKIGEDRRRSSSDTLSVQSSVQSSVHSSVQSSANSSGLPLEDVSEEIFRQMSSRKHSISSCKFCAQKCRCRKYFFDYKMIHLRWFGNENCKMSSQFWQGKRFMEKIAKHLVASLHCNWCLT